MKIEEEVFKEFINKRFEVGFSIYGKSQPEQRARMGKGGFFYIPKETREFQHIVQKEFVETIEQLKKPSWIELPHKGACELIINIYKSLPKSLPKWKCNLLERLKNERLDVNPVINAGDCDNYAKIIADALQGIAFVNDRQCNTMFIFKKFTFGFPRTEIKIIFQPDINLLYRAIKDGNKK